MSSTKTVFNCEHSKIIDFVQNGRLIISFGGQDKEHKVAIEIEIRREEVGTPTVRTTKVEKDQNSKTAIRTTKVEKDQNSCKLHQSDQNSERPTYSVLASKNQP